MQVNAVLGQGFAGANRRLDAVLLDLFWKFIWLLIVATIVTGFGIWLYAGLGTIEVSVPAERLKNPVALMLIARQLWTQYSVQFVGFVASFLIVSAVTWVVLEAYFRSGALADENVPFFENTSRHFRHFIATAVLKQLCLIGLFTLMAAIVLGPLWTAPLGEWRQLWSECVSPLLLAAAVAGILWFVLTVFETVLRLDALETFGRELFTTVGLIGVLVLFEAMMAGSVIGVGIIAMSFVSDTAGLWLLLSGVILAAIVLTVLHSYLIVVRYSAMTLLARTSLVPEGAGIIGHVEEFRDDSHSRFWLPIHSTDRTPHS